MAQQCSSLGWSTGIFVINAVFEQYEWLVFGTIRHQTNISGARGAFNELHRLGDCRMLRASVYTVAHESPLSVCEKFHHVLCFDYYLNAGDIALAEEKTRNYGKGNYGGMCDHFRRIDWPCVLDNKNLNESYDEFLQYNNRACDEFIPFRSNPTRLKSASWMTKDIK